MPVWMQQRRIASKRVPIGEEVPPKIGGSFLRKLYNFANEAVAGTIGGGGDSPEFPVEVANRYYPEKYQVPVRLQQAHLSWFPYLPEEKFGHTFDMSPLPLVL
jgi:hypothetical protein